MNDDILNIFYSEVIPEASTGRVDCYFYRNVLFNTNIDNNLIKSNKYENVLKPTLMIKNKTEFDKALVQYVETAQKIYHKYPDDDITFKDYLKEIMTTVWSNATVEDFNNPIAFLKRRIKIINDDNFNYQNHKIGTIFNQDIFVTRKIESVLKETPYALEFKIGDNSLPLIRYGIADNTAFIYAIQNESGQIDKKLSRNLYKLKSGFNEDGESYDNINDFENLTGVTPSFLASLTLALGLFNKEGITNLEAISYLPVRLNGKVILKELKQKKTDNLDIAELNEKIETQMRNETDKFTRHFRRLQAQFTGLEVTSLPMDVDTSMHLKLGDGTFSNDELAALYYPKLSSSNQKR